MPRTYQVISADGHVETPPDLWTKYASKKAQERAPRLVKLAEGGEGWIVEGQPMMHNGQNVSAGRPVKYHNESYWFPDGTPVPGSGGGAQRLREQDQDGIDAEVLYPPVWSTRFIENINDHSIYLSLIQAYNTFLAQELCAVAPDRLIGTGVIPVSGIEDAINEMDRCREMGLKSVTFHQFPNGSDHPEKEDDRFWNRALETGMLLSPHGGFGRRTAMAVGSTGSSYQDFATSLFSLIHVSAMFQMCNVIASGVLDRIPALRFFMAETHAGWMPSAFWMVDSNYRMFGHCFGSPLKMKPTDYIKRHFLFSIVHEPVHMWVDQVPVDNIMWGSDTPHSVTTFPRSREWMRESFKGVPEAIKRKILLENPAKYFGLDLEKPLTPTPK